jgi:hypothetical protein
MIVQLYMDGALAATRTVIDPCGLGRARMGPWLNHLLIGAGNDRGWGTNGFAGHIDEFAVYSGILSPDRIATHYAAWQPRDCVDFTDRLYGVGVLISDINGDCRVNFADFAELAFDWLECNDPAGGC